MTQEDKDSELLAAIKELAEAQQQNACYLRKGRRYVEELKKAAKALGAELDILDPACTDSHAGMNQIEIPTYASRKEVGELVAAYRASTKAEDKNAKFVRRLYPCLKL